MPVLTDNDEHHFVMGGPQIDPSTFHAVFGGKGAAKNFPETTEQAQCSRPGQCAKGQGGKCFSENECPDKIRQE